MFPIVACHSQSVWDDLHGTVSAGLGALSDLLDEHDPRPPAEPRQPFPAAGALPLAATTCPQDAPQTLQSNPRLYNNLDTNRLKASGILHVVASCLFLQEVVSTSNSNTVMSLCRLFEMLLTEPMKSDDGDKNTRTWIMVKNWLILSCITWHSTQNICFVRLWFYVNSAPRFLYHHRQPLPSLWCGLWVVAVMQTAERSLVSSSG